MDTSGHLKRLVRFIGCRESFGLLDASIDDIHERLTIQPLVARIRVATLHRDAAYCPPLLELTTFRVPSQPCRGVSLS
ncbi:hypothetical protein J6590_068810 [Homalodisca vitripennis]|nr:hypothetical protein J6590_068810 [Homalodisca vitripennis]